MKLYGFPFSTCTRKVLTTLAEKGQEVEFVLVDMTKGEHKQPAHVARQPFGKVPALEHDGFTMYESRAISRYVDDVLPGPKLVPEGAKERAAMEQWVSFEQSYFSPVVATVMFERLLKPAGGGTTDEAAVSAALTKLGPVLDVVERRLGASEFLAGSTFSLADVFFLPHVEVLAMTKTLEDLAASRPAFAAWWKRVSERPSWKKAKGGAK